MKRLIVMRHAKSDWGDSSLQDIERPLNGRGRKDAPRMGAMLVEAGYRPELILRSPARRTEETAAGLLEAFGTGCAITVVERFYPGGPGAFLRALAEYGGQADTLLLLAHNPGVEDFASRLAGEDLLMPTAAAAVFETPQGDPERARLLALLLPRDAR